MKEWRSIAVVIAVLIAIAAGGLAWQVQVMQQHNRQINDEKIKHLAQEFSQLHTQNDSLIAQIQSQQKTNQQSEDWVLAEANYLVKLANFNLAFDHNVANAQLLLKTADNYIAQLNDPRLINVRQSLADSLAKLQAVPKTDPEGILLQLDALGAQVANLPIIATPEDKANVQPPQQHHHHQPGWKRNLEESWRQIQKLVVIQYHEQMVDQLVAPADRNYLDMHLQLLLGQAQWAVMHEKQKLYRHSLMAAQEWVKNYYVETSPKTQAMIAGLQTLAEQNINPALPSIIISVPTSLTQGTAS